MSDSCNNCGESFDYDIEWDDPPKGEGHIKITWNPRDEPPFVVGETREYCSLNCVHEDADNHPF